MTVNALGQSIGRAVEGWAPPQRPPREPLLGRYCRVEPLDVARHAAELHAANRADPTGRNWTYLPAGPFDAFEPYRDWPPPPPPPFDAWEPSRDWLAAVSAGDDPLFHAIVDRASGLALGVAAYLRVD